MAPMIKQTREMVCRPNELTVRTLLEFIDGLSPQQVVRIKMDDNPLEAYVTLTAGYEGSINVR